MKNSVSSRACLALGHYVDRASASNSKVGPIGRSFSPPNDISGREPLYVFTGITPPPTTHLSSLSAYGACGASMQTMTAQDKRPWTTLRGNSRYPCFHLQTSWNKRHDVNSYNKYAHTWMTSPVPSNPAAVKGVCVGVADWMMPRAAASRGLLEGVGATLTTA